MLDRETVDHVAQLARLQLTDAESEKMAIELSQILDHIEAIRSLDLEGVEPTSHVVDVVNLAAKLNPRIRRRQSTELELQ